MLFEYFLEIFSCRLVDMLKGKANKKSPSSIHLFLIVHWYRPEHYISVTLLAFIIQINKTRTSAATFWILNCVIRSHFFDPSCCGNPLKLFDLWCCFGDFLDQFCQKYHFQHLQIIPYHFDPKVLDVPR